MPMVEAQETVLYRGTIVSNVNVGIFKSPLDKTIVAGSDRACNCSGRIDLLLLIYRFICYVCYNLFRAALWQYLAVMETMQRCRVRGIHHKLGNPPKLSYGDAQHLDDEDFLREENTNDLCYDNSWIDADDEKYDDSSIKRERSWVIENSNNDNVFHLNSSGDTIDENVLFFTYLEDINDSTENQYDDDPSEMLDPLDRLLQHFDIDWDTPFYDQSKTEEETEEEFHAQDDKYFIDDDCLVLDATYHNDFSFGSGESLYDFDDPVDVNLQLYNDAFSLVGSDSVELPITDEDVLAAITGVPVLSPPRMNVAENSLHGNK